MERYRERKLKLKIETIIWKRKIVDKLAIKHNVTTDEVEEVLNSRPKVRFMEKGKTKNEDVYIALGQTSSGRYLAVLFIYKKPFQEALILSARDMARKERKQYDKR
jgi:hypothetical protein